ncbi:hypothetical protein [Sorangium cellulosum]|uniref:Uncharacterized protein n=1 Tax=Sorangium cellulosum TaxID=56 RepID=A0A150QTT4_SORCE|nr:hypothetical protein [Sorangium cellulosum]KYF71252.1 hypothetical protein BE15_26280 [Sorangium cellulosum]
MISDATNGLMVEIPTASSPSALHAEVLHNQNIPFIPEWQFRTLTVGPRRSSPIYDQHIVDTVGSSYDFGDEMRFGKEDGLLRGLVLTMPDRNMENAVDAIDAWLNTTRIQALLRLASPIPFALDGADVRAMDEDGRILLATLNSGARWDGQRLRIAVSTDTDLLFTDGRFCGWLLMNPLEHLRYGDGRGAEPSAASSGGEALELLRSYLALVAEPNIERMEDQDEELKIALADLKHRAAQASLRELKAREITAQLDDLLDRFYG